MLLNINTLSKLDAENQKKLKEKSNPFETKQKADLLTSRNPFQQCKDHTLELQEGENYRAISELLCSRCNLAEQKCYVVQNLRALVCKPILWVGTVRVQYGCFHKSNSPLEYRTG